MQYFSCTEVLAFLDKILVSMITLLKNKKGQEKPAKHQGKIISLNWKVQKSWESEQAGEN